MNSQTASPVPPDPLNLATTLPNATIEKVKGNEFSNTAGDTIKITVNNYNLTKEECSDAIDCLQHAVPLLIAKVRKNDQSRSIAAETSTGADYSDPVPQAVTPDHTLEGDPVNISDIVPPEPSSLPVASTADRYTRSMLKCLAGYPLYDPKPLSELSKEYLHNGVTVGDVGFVRENGTFDFLFNICPSQTALINPPNLPDGFSLENPDHSVTRNLDPLPRKTRLFQSPITRTNSGEYICEGLDGGILELPEGAIEDEAFNIRPFAELAARHGVQWYEYTMTRGRDISNGALYLITSFTKCSQWGIAVFDRKCAPGQGLRFDRRISLPFRKSTSKYHWKGSHTFPTKASNLKQGDAPNQCVFLRGYKIMLRQDIFDNLCSGQPHGSDPAMPSSSLQPGSSYLTVTRQRATRIRGGGGPDPMSKIPTGGGLLSPITTKTKSDEVVLHPNFNPSLVHPSDFINVALLSQNPNAKVALTHDDVWCIVLRENFPKLSHTSLINIARSYTSTVDGYDCVSLVKISDSSNVLDQGSRPLQGTETPTLQGPLTTLDVTDEDCTPVSSTISLTLPRELVERVLLLLDTESMLTCKLVSREFNEIIQSSTSLQYLLACKAAGVIDNPTSPLTYGERLEVLEKGEDAWRELKPVFETMINVNHQKSHIYRLTGGALLLSDNNLKDLNYCHLPSSPQNNPRWNRIPGHGPGEGSPGILVNFGLAIHEHDLIVNVFSSGIGNQADTQQHSLDLILLKLSTGEYHPFARHPRIHIQSSPAARPRVMPRIVGNHLALIVHSRDGTFPDKLFIFDWKTGHKRLQHEATENAYSSLVFISPEILLVPNLVLSHFEVWHLPSHPNTKPPVQILSLKIPAISRDYSLAHFSCRGEPSPFLHSMQYFPPRPFFPSPENSIISTNIRMSISSNSPSSRRRRASYTLIMHRRALLDTIQKRTSPSFLEQKEDLSMWLTNEVRVHKIADPDDGSVRPGVQSKFVSMLPDPRSSPRTPGSLSFPSQTSPTSHMSAGSGSSSISSRPSRISSASRYNFLQVQWADWGPPISRWLQINETQASWNVTSAGQRYAFAVPNPHDRSKLMVRVANFDPHEFRRVEEMMLRLGRAGEDNGKNERYKQGKEGEYFKILDHEGVFSEEVCMGLACVFYDAPEGYDFDVVLIDEERLLGVKLDRDRKIECVKVLYFG